jgi:hypothetical protein
VLFNEEPEELIRYVALIHNSDECLCPPALANPRYVVMHGIRIVTMVMAYVADAVEL